METRSKLFGGNEGDNLYKSVCPPGTFIKEFRTTSTDNLNGIDILCSDGTLIMGPQVINPGGSPCVAKSEVGFDGIEILPGRIRDTDAILYYKPKCKA